MAQQPNSNDGPSSTGKSMKRTLSQLFHLGQEGDGKLHRSVSIATTRGSQTMRTVARGVSSSLLRRGDQAPSTTTPTTATGSMRAPRPEGKGTVRSLANTLKRSRPPATTAVVTPVAAPAPTPAKTIFGAPLEDVMNRQKIVFEQEERSRRTPDLKVPGFFNKCIEHVILRGIRTEGILRLAGSTQETKALRQQIEQGIIVNLYAVPVHNLVDLAKMFVREIPGSLFDCTKYDAWMQVADIDASQPVQKAMACKKMVESLDEHRQAVTTVLFFFLKEVSKFSKQNKMDAVNIAKVFGPNMLTCPGKYDPVREMNAVSKTTNLVETMLKHYDVVFSELSTRYKVVHTVQSSKAVKVREHQPQVKHREVPDVPKHVEQPPAATAASASAVVTEHSASVEQSAAEAQHKSKRARSKVQSAEDMMLKKDRKNESMFKRSNTVLSMKPKGGVKRSGGLDVEEAENVNNSPLKKQMF